MEKKLKIAVVCGHFMPEVGYVEVQMAKALTHLGHHVHVFTSNLLSPSVKAKLQPTPCYSLGTSEYKKIQVTRFKAYFSLGQMVKCKGLEEGVHQFQPDVILIIGLGKLFPLPVVKSKRLTDRKVVLLADNEDSFDCFKGVKGLWKKIKKKLLRKLLKDPVYRTAVDMVSQFYVYTPSATDVVLSYLPKNKHATFLQKVKPLSLGFNTEDFYFDEEIRLQKRKKLDWKEEDVVLITATRVTPFKAIEKMVDLVDQLNEEGKFIKYFIAGFGTDDYSVQLKKYISLKKHATQFICQPFLTHKELLELYNAADIGYWPTHIITHYEAMGTGLPIVLPDKKNIQHIIKQGVNGWKVKDSTIYDTFSEAINEIDNYRKRRNDMASKAKEQFDFTAIASKII